MDKAELRTYVEAYDRRVAAREAARRRQAQAARARVAELARICRSFGATRVRLFGSLVTERYGATPDIDLAIDGVPPERYFELWAALDRAEPPLPVDLVDTAIAPASLLQRLEREGVDV